MSSFAPMTSTSLLNDQPASAKLLRIPNPLRAGLISFLATLAVVGGLLEVLNVVVDRGIDSYYGKRIAALAEPSTDPAYAIAKAASAEEAAADGATVSAN